MRLHRWNYVRVMQQYDLNHHSATTLRAILRALCAKTVVDGDWSALKIVRTYIVQELFELVK